MGGSRSISVVALTALLGAALACVRTAPPASQSGGMTAPQPGGAMDAQATQIADAVEGTLTARAPTPAPTIGTPQPGQTGTVTGAVCYPGEGIPPMTIFAQNIATGDIYALPHPAQDVVTAEYGPHQSAASSYTFGNLPGGAYYFFAYLGDGGNLGADAAGGGYTVWPECSAEGRHVACPHTLIPVVVRSGFVTEGVDICDWYDADADPGFPPDPRLP